MNMTKLYEDLKVLADEEYKRSSEVYGPLNHSAHESHALLAEEVEEASECMEQLVQNLSKFWRLVRYNEDPAILQTILQGVYREALCLAAEAVQCAGLAYKAIISIEAEYGVGDK